MSYGDAYQSFKKLTKEIEKKPDDADLYFQRGNASVGMLEDKAAIEDFNRAIQLNPSQAEYYYRRGWVYQEKLYRYKEAFHDYHQVVKLDTNHKVAYERLYHVASMVYYNAQYQIKEKTLISESKNNSKFADLNSDMIEKLSVCIFCDAKLAELTKQGYDRGAFYRLLAQSSTADIFEAIKLLPHKLAVFILSQCLKEDTAFTQKLVERGIQKSELDNMVKSTYHQLPHNQLRQGIRFMSLGRRSDDSLLKLIPAEIALNIASYISPNLDLEEVKQIFNCTYKGQ